MRPWFQLTLIVPLLLLGCSPNAPAPGPLVAPKESQSTGAPATPTSPPAETLALPPHPGMAQRPEVQAFLSEMVQKEGFNRAALVALFEKTGTVPKVLDAMAKPYEAKPWPAYRALFLTEKRIQGGQQFLIDQQSALSRAKARFGVPPAMITAIIGIESAYGARAGNYRVLDALATLAFDYPRRAAFFRRELQEFLLLCREESIDALKPTGSYAGAMGMPQFMPSSFRKLAADGDGDGHRDIWQNPADAIASVAQYFARNGWHPGEPIGVPARVSGGSFQRIVSHQSTKPTQTLSALKALGVTPKEPVPEGLKGALLELPGKEGPEYWITFHNFNVIQRYNHSVLYAMAATELFRIWTR